MQKKDWLLLLVADHIEPIQLQKALFKFAKESGVPSREAYSFVPYDWGPCSFEVYENIDYLREAGLIEAAPSGRGWNAYHLTSAGQEVTEKITSKADGSLLEKLEEIRDWVTSRSFQQLLRDVYDDYPKYATQSLFTR